MHGFHKFPTTFSHGAVYLLDETIPRSRYTPIDLSNGNRAIGHRDISDPEICQEYVDEVMTGTNALVAFGGYLEKRNLYTDKGNFQVDGRPRTIHLGIDFWTDAGTRVIVPLDGKVHSFKDNKAHGDYGPTIILEHSMDGFRFFTLYGHLSLGSLNGIYRGRQFEKGSILGTLGPVEVNGGYAPHLHFQIIGDLENNYGDYPGVCSEDELNFYSKNCPDPNLLLRLD